MKYLLVLVFFLGDVLGNFDIDDSVLFKVEFPGYSKAKKNGEAATSEKDLFTEESETYTIVDKYKAKYECTIPKVKTDDGNKASDYTGLSPLGLMEKMFSQLPCAYRLETYWTYELCHGRFLRQYHEERAGKDLKVQEYFLGKFSKDKLNELMKEEEKDKENDITRHPPTKKIEAMNMPYFELVMEDGTLCDLNNQPRKTRVLYICYPAGRNEIYNLKETSTCEYEVIVLTSILCTHPAFKPKEVSEHGISCRPIDQSIPAKPVDLVDLETESAKLRSEKTWEAHMRGGDKPGQVKIEIRPTGGSPQIDSTDDDDDSFMEIKKSKGSLWKESKREPFQPSMDPTIVKEFLRGEYCLYGGSGWWKYEFCYGKKVEQYHQDNNGKKTVINLGNFDTKDHLAWLQTHPSKRPKPVDQRKHVSHFYSKGEICDVTGKPRHIEVKLKCRKSSSPSTVTLYLLEPRTCEYVLGVESPLVCDILPHADMETGLMPPGIMDSLDSLTGADNTETNRKIPIEKLIDDEDPVDLKELEEEGLFTEEERKRLEALRDRLAKQNEALQPKTTFFKSSVTKKETKSSSTKETRGSDGTSYSSVEEREIHETTKDGIEGPKSVKSVKVKVMVKDGVKTTMRETILDGDSVQVHVEEEPYEQHTDEIGQDKHHPDQSDQEHPDQESQKQHKDKDEL